MLPLALLLSACASDVDDTATGLGDEAQAAPMAAEAPPVAEVDLNGAWIDLDGRHYTIYQNGDHLWVRLHRVNSGMGRFVGPRGINIGFPGSCCAGFLPEGEDDTIYWSNATQWKRE